MNIKKMISLVSEVSGKSVKEINIEMKLQSTELSGLVDTEGCLVIVAKNLGFTMKDLIDGKVETAPQPLSSAMKNLLKTVMADKNIAYDKATKNDKGFIRQFRLGNEKSENTKQLICGKNFTGKIFILNIKEYSDYHFVNIMVFPNETAEYDVFSIIPPKFMQEITELKVLGTLYEFSYDGKSVMSATNSQGDYTYEQHRGTLIPIEKFGKFAQTYL